jgi:hypothetical protein
MLYDTLFRSQALQHPLFAIHFNTDCTSPSLDLDKKVCVVTTVLDLRYAVTYFFVSHRACESYTEGHMALVQR